MDTKINLQQLARKVAMKKHISQRSAETFLREFFDAITRNVTIDKSIKITGLGSFKLIEVQDRESVDVNTGERIIIPGHSKLSFTPDNSLKETVNKPFADFQTVVINEGTNLEEMEKIPQEKIDQDTDPVIQDSSSVEEDAEDVEIDSESEDIPEPETEDAPETEPAPEQESASEQEQEEKSELERVHESEEDFSPFAPQEVRAMTTAEKWALTLGIILLCVVSYFVGYYRVLGFTPKSSIVVEEIDSLVAEEDSMMFPIKENQEDSVSHADSVSLQEDTASATPVVEEEQVAVDKKVERSQEEATRPTLVRGKKYQITGTRKTHIMKRGDYLTKIALEEYGEREFAKYIIAHNHFPDPNNVPIGKEILIPELEEVK